jgi:hypothetical protein
MSSTGLLSSRVMSTTMAAPCASAFAMSAGSGGAFASGDAAVQSPTNPCRLTGPSVPSARWSTILGRRRAASLAAFRDASETSSSPGSKQSSGTLAPSTSTSPQPCSFTLCLPQATSRTTNMSVFFIAPRS